MNIKREIKKLCDQIAREFNPERIILFGSYAYGKPTSDSDVDLLVVMPFDGPTWQQAISIRDKINPPFPLDLLVRTPQQVAERIALEDFFMREITERGKIMYEAAHA